MRSEGWKSLKGGIKPAKASNRITNKPYRFYP